eukprot:TRINITY_DN1395_c0_g1::TRINITY_DN1395_c0_g1_i1::g.19974::m.19974 TRINITY_DN1395_c0_g1::TRINITY_DN1395_c0_g1_i1::g.19974  ORF type:complete len:173 (+),score=63.37,Na_K-ATPase/PF00287.13/0.046 TRINITY_DN1395_c0_g1_i1:26-520(+)
MVEITKEKINKAVKDTGLWLKDLFDFKKSVGVNEKGEKTYFEITAIDWVKVLATFVVLYGMFIAFFSGHMVLGLQVRKNHGNYVEGTDFGLAAISCSRAIGYAIECYGTSKGEAEKAVLECKEKCDYNEHYHFDIKGHNATYQLHVICSLDPTLYQTCVLPDEE